MMRGKMLTRHINGRIIQRGWHETHPRALYVAMQASSRYWQSRFGAMKGWMSARFEATP